MQSINSKLFFALLLSAHLTIFAISVCSGRPADASEGQYLEIARRFADNVLDKGRDHWSGRDTPLLADGINVDTGEPVVWRFRGDAFIIHNLASQQNLFRVLSGLTNLSGEETYENAAREAIRYHFDNLASPCGKLRWGGHQIINLKNLRPVGHFDANCHEFKNNFPFYELMWRVDEEKTADFIRAFWQGHVRNWRNLTMNRHAGYGGGPPPSSNMWETKFDDPEPFFAANALSFLNCGSDLIYSGGVFYGLSGEKGALNWARRLAGMYTKARHPDTGMGAYQYTRPRRRRRPPEEGPLTGRLTWDTYGDRTENQFFKSGSSHPEDEFYNPIKGKMADDGMPVAREGWMVRPGGFPWYARIQLYLGEILGVDGKSFAEDAADHLQAHAEYSYVPQKNHWLAMWADGTDATGLKNPRTGYHGPRGRVFRARNASYSDLEVYARAYRLTGRDALRQTVRSMAKGLGIGDIGEPDGGKTAFRTDAPSGSPHLVFALLELHRSHPDPDLLQLARSAADIMIEERFHNGFFLPTSEHINASFDAIEPLALITLEATLRGVPEKVPTHVGGRGFIHGRFDGLGRTYDSRAIWDQKRSAEVYLDGAPLAGTLSGSPQARNGSYLFDGRRDSVVFHDLPHYRDGDSFTIILGARALENKRFLCAYRYHLQRSAFRTRGNNSLTVQTGIKDDRWRLIAISYKGAGRGKEKTITLYVDGEIVDSDSTTGSPLSSYQSRPLSVGKTEHSGGIYAKTQIGSRIFVFNRAMDADEIGEIKADIAEQLPDHSL